MKLLMYLVGIVLLLVLVIFVATPAQTDPDYPERYLEALVAHTGVPVQEAHFEPFVAFVTHMSAPDWRDYFNQVYAEKLHFSDTLAVVDSRDSLGAYFNRLHQSGADSTVRVLSRQISGNDGYLLWEMHSAFKPFGTTRHSHTIGVTHLRFDKEGRVVLHQDFWDAAQGFYQHLPVLGRAINSIRDGLQPES